MVLKEFLDLQLKGIPAGLLAEAHGVAIVPDVIKVGHHGSINASPHWSFTTVMPAKLAGNAAVISTDDDRFTGENEVPKDSVLNGWRGRLKNPSRLLRTDAKNLGESVAGFKV